MKCNKKMLLSAFLIVLVVCLCVVTAFASGAEREEAAEDLMEDFLNDIVDIYDVVVSISMPIATVAISWAGLNAILGDDRDTERAVVTLKWVVIAMAALYFLPSFLSFAISIFSAYGWDPSSL